MDVDREYKIVKGKFRLTWRLDSTLGCSVTNCIETMVWNMRNLFTQVSDV